MSEAKLEANFSTLIISIASSAAMSMGLAPNPQTQKTEKDLKMAQFNIDLLNLLKEKTQNNLTKDEEMFIKHVISDLQLKFVQAKNH